MTAAMGVLRSYLQGLQAIQLTGEAVEETSYYGQLEKALNEVGRSLSPAVRASTSRNWRWRRRNTGSSRPRPWPDGMC